jgi:hypothetical protein
MKTSKRGSFDIQNLQSVPLSSLSKRRKFFANVCRLLWTKFTHHQKFIPFAPLILGLLDQLSDAKVYTKIDIHGAYNLVRI